MHSLYVRPFESKLFHLESTFYTFSKNAHRTRIKSKYFLMADNLHHLICFFDSGNLPLHDLFVDSIDRSCWNCIYDRLLCLFYREKLGVLFSSFCFCKLFLWCLVLCHFVFVVIDINEGNSLFECIMSECLSKNFKVWKSEKDVLK